MEGGEGSCASGDTDWFCSAGNVTSMTRRGGFESVNCRYVRKSVVGRDMVMPSDSVSEMMKGLGMVPSSALALAAWFIDALGRAMITRLGFLTRRSIALTSRSKSRTSLVFSELAKARKFWTVTGASEAGAAFTFGVFVCVNGREGRVRSVGDAAQRDGSENVMSVKVGKKAHTNTAMKDMKGIRCWARLCIKAYL